MKFAVPKDRTGHLLREKQTALVTRLQEDKRLPGLVYQSLNYLPNLLIFYVQRNHTPTHCVRPLLYMISQQTVKIKQYSEIKKDNSLYHLMGRQISYLSMKYSARLIVVEHTDAS